MKGTAAEKIARDAAVVADRARGLPWKLVAERNGVSERGARDAWAERSFALEGQPARDVVADQLRQFDATIEELAELAVTTANDSVRLGAIRTRHEVIKDRLELMRFAHLTRPLELVGTTCDMNRILDTMKVVFEKYGVSKEAGFEMMERLEDPLCYVRAA